jgi:hypothetical protein
MLRKAKNFCQRDRVGYVYIRRGRLPPGAHFEKSLGKSQKSTSQKSLGKIQN